MTPGTRIKRFFAGAEPDDILLLTWPGTACATTRATCTSRQRHRAGPAVGHGAGGQGRHPRDRDSPARRIVVLLDCCYAGAFDDRKDLDHAGPPPRPSPRSAPPRPATLGTPRRPRRRARPRPGGHRRRHRIQQAIEGKTRRAVHPLRGARPGDRRGRPQPRRRESTPTSSTSTSTPGCVRSAPGRRQKPTYSAHRMQGMLRVAHSATRARRPIYVPAAARRDREPRAPRGPRRTRRPAPAVGLRVPAGRRRAPARPVARPGRTPAGRAACPVPAQLRVAAAPGGLGAYREVASGVRATGWPGSTPGAGRRSVRLPGRRREMSPTGCATTGGRTTDGRDYLRDVGPHPDVWLPERRDRRARGRPPAVGHDVDRAELDRRSTRSHGAGGGADPDRARRTGAGGSRRRAPGGPPYLAGAVRPGRAGGRGGPRRVRRPRRWRGWPPRSSTPTARSTRPPPGPVEQRARAGPRPAAATRSATGRAAVPPERSGTRRPRSILTEQQLVRFNRGDPPGGACPRVRAAGRGPAAARTTRRIPRRCGRSW